MAFDTTGVYSGLANSFNDAVSNTIIDPADWNALFSDIETAINAVANGTAYVTTDVPSAPSVNLGASTTMVVRITGTTTINSFGSVTNCLRFVYFAASLSLTYNATSMILPGAASITTAAGDFAVFKSDSSGNWRCLIYTPSYGSGVLAFLATPTSANLRAALTDETGTGAAVFATSPTLVTPLLGTPTSGTLTNCTGLPVSGIMSSTSTALGVGSLELGHATDTTLSRASAGVLAVEGVNVLTTATGQPLDAELTAIAGLTSAADSAPYFTGSGTAALMTVTTAARSILDDTTVGAIRTTLGVGTADNPQFATIELGAASDTTLARSGAGDMTIEGNAVYRAGGTDVPVTDGGTGRSTGTTAYALIATGTTATGAQQTLASGATTEILVGGGASALPVWTTATGSGSPVRATSPTLTNPVVGTQAALDNSTKAASTAYVDATTREKLSGARTYYVRTDGSDSNTGLVNSAGGAFLTIQKAINAAAGIDTVIYAVTISVGAGTFSEALICQRLVGGGTVTITGAGATTIIAGGGASAVTCAVPGYTIGSVKMTGNIGVYVDSGGALTVASGTEFGACTFSHTRVLNSGKLNFSGNYTISGGTTTHLNASMGGTIEHLSVTCTLTGTPAFSSAFAYVDGISRIWSQSVTFSGSATGSRYYADTNSVIQTYGSGANYFPGNAAGSTATGGIYG